MPKRVEGIVLHHSDSWFGDASIIDTWHRVRGFRNPVTGKSIGYNRVFLNGIRKATSTYVEALDGFMEIGRAYNLDEVVTADEQGAHTLGFNGKTFGWCYIGKGAPSIFQAKAIIKEFLEIKKVMPWLWLKPHYEFNDTLCPAFDVPKWLKEYKHMRIKRHVYFGTNKVHNE